MLIPFEDYLKKICRKCKIRNGRCIKDEPYIGLCSKNDKYELFEDWKKQLND